MTRFACSDHLGNTFKSKKEMCRHYGKSASLVNHRMNIQGMSLEDALTRSTTEGCTDHQGNMFKDFDTMCEAYGIESRLVYSRLNAGMTLQEALTRPVKKVRGTPVYLQDGTLYRSIAEFCDSIGISRNCYQRMSAKGMSADDIKSLYEQRNKHKV